MEIFDHNQSIIDKNKGQKMLDTFWEREMASIDKLTMTDFRNQELPLARIKKIMKLDEDVKMISAEAPVLFAKAAEMFISELSLRAWINTCENKRRTLQKTDISSAISKFEQFDFLIDIVPREEKTTKPKVDDSQPLISGDLNLLLQMAQQPQVHTATGQPVQILHNSTQNQPFTISPQVFQVPVQGNNSNQSQDSQSLIQINSSSDSQLKNDENKTTISSPIIQSIVYNGADVVRQIPLTLPSPPYQTIIHNTQNSNTSQPLIINSLPTQFITNNGQVVQAIIPSTAKSAVEQTLSTKLGQQMNKNCL